MPKDVHDYIRYVSASGITESNQNLYIHKNIWLSTSMSMPCHCPDWIRPNAASMPDRSTNEDTSDVTATYSFYPDESCPYARPTMTQTIATASPLQSLPLHSVHYRRLSSAYSRYSRHAVLVHIGSSSVELEDRRLGKSTMTTKFQTRDSPASDPQSTCLVPTQLFSLILSSLSTRLRPRTFVDTDAVNSVRISCPPRLGVTDRKVSGLGSLK
jgi:hypothetical protein